MFFLSGLNSPQRQAAETVEGPVLILAGAGSGKTRTVTYRVAHMISNLNISPKEILGVSFTNKAAKEMRDRVFSLLTKKRARGITLTTFHSLGVRILRQKIDLLGYLKNFTIYDSNDQLSIIREALKNYRADKENYDRKIILSKIGFLKNNGICEKTFPETPHFDPDSPYDIVTEYCYNYYQDKLRFFNAIDFDDILFLTVRLFREFPELKKEFSDKYKYIMIDEYQDTNSLQFEVVLALTASHHNLCVVGDDDQSIYAFRGANVQNILNFEEHFPGAKVIKLEQNYRSTTPIIQLANEVIKKNTQRREKNLFSTNPSDQKPILWAMGNTDHESEVIVEEIVQHQGNGGHLGDIAVLYRSKTQAKPIEDQLRMSNVPYTIIGGQKFYDKKEIKDLIAYLCVIQNPADEISLRRILNVPSRGIGVATLKKFIEVRDKEEMTLFEAMIKYPELGTKNGETIKSFTKLIQDLQQFFKDNSLKASILKMIDEIKYLKFVDQQYEENLKLADAKKNDIEHFISSAERFQGFVEQENALKFFIEKLLLQDSQDKNDDDEEDEDIRKNEVTLMTLHSSKGLEFEKVYLIGVEEELLPHKKTIKDNQDINEELRLAYVGLTRAKSELFMTYCKERKLYGKNIPRHKSRFLHELPKDSYIEQDRTVFGHLTIEQAEAYKKIFENLMSELD